MSRGRNTVYTTSNKKQLMVRNYLWLQITNVFSPSPCSVSACLRGFNAILKIRRDLLVKFGKRLIFFSSCTFGIDLLNEWFKASGHSASLEIESFKST